MAITIDYPNKIIFIPRADLQIIQLSPSEIRQLDLNVFRLELRDLEDSEEGAVYDTTVQHIAPLEISGVTLARVVQIINGYTVTFEDGQYAVNVVGGNTNLGDVTNVNQVSVRTSNSAGLTYSKQVEDLSYSDGRVFIDTVNGQPGSQYPRGTSSDPVDNLVDALSIIQQRNLPRRLYLKGTLTAQPSDDLSNFDIKADDSILGSLNVLTGCPTDQLVVKGCFLTGDLNGRVVAKQCTTLSNLDEFDGRLISSGIQGTVTLGLSSDQHEFINCYSQQSSITPPTIDCNLIPNLSCYFRNYSGSLRIINFVSGTLILDLDPGSVEIDPSCIGGTIIVKGTGNITDNSGINCTVIKSGFIEGESVEVIKRIVQADEEVRDTYYRKIDKDTGDILLDKVVTRNGTDINLTES